MGLQAMNEYPIRRLLPIATRSKCISFVAHSPSKQLLFESCLEDNQCLVLNIMKNDGFLQTFYQRH